MLYKLHVGDDFGLEQADGVACDRVAKAGVEFFGDGRAADDITALDDADFQPGAGQIEGADEAVVARTDNDRIVFFCHIHFRRALSIYRVEVGEHALPVMTPSSNSIYTAAHGGYCRDCIDRRPLARPNVGQSTGQPRGGG